MHHWLAANPWMNQNAVINTFVDVKRLFATSDACISLSRLHLTSTTDIEVTTWLPYLVETVSNTLGDPGKILVMSHF